MVSGKPDMSGLQVPSPTLVNYVIGVVLDITKYLMRSEEISKAQKLK
jgi:hypothetical protein